MLSLGETIRKLREETGLPLRTVAGYLDIDQAILSKVERGLRNPSRELVIKLASYFQVSEKDLLLAWLADKILYEVSDEENGLEALQMAEDRVSYLAFQKIDRNEIIAKIKSVFEKFDSVNKAWLFGSFSRADDNPKSDIDILIDVPPQIEFTLFDIAEIQEQIQNVIKRKVDVVMLSAMRPQIKDRIKKDMKLIYEA